MATVSDGVSSSVQTMSNLLDEILQWLPEDLTIGDDGVLEHLVCIENDLMFIKRRFYQREHTSGH